MKQKLIAFQIKVLGFLSGRVNDFYLAGGSALSLYYFHHRQSLDLDFFMPDFNQKRILETVDYLSGIVKKKIELTAQNQSEDKVKIMVFLVPFDKTQSLKIDFVQDYVQYIKPPNLINGIKVLSLEDICLRKIFAIIGTYRLEDTIGRKVLGGGRQEAKDFYDLYCLSHTFMRISDFSSKYCSQIMREGLVRWFRTYSRLEMKTGLLELKLNKKVDFVDIERHFKREINKIIEEEVDFI